MTQVLQKDCLQFKADFLPITILRLLHHESDLIQAQLENIIQKAPQFFVNAPVIIDCSALNERSDAVDLKSLCDLLRQYQMQPIAVRGIKKQNELPVLSPEIEKRAQPLKKAASIVKETTKIITKPVRAGTQIYVKEGDLIVLSSVNAGAEIVADGHIHVYGPLRGRALAGANGDMNAKIFCKQLEAELISIAGRYWLSEKIKEQAIEDAFVQIYLKDEELHIEVL